MSRSSGFDPLDRFRWKVYVFSPAGALWARAGFTSCTTPDVTVNFKTYQEGGRHMMPRKIHDSAGFSPITLARGVIARQGSDDFAKWMNDLFKVTHQEPGAADAPNYRNDIVIEHLDRDSTVVKRYVLFNCVPSHYKPASDFSALDEAEISVETLSFEYEGFKEERVNSLEDVGDYVRRFTRGIF